MSLSVRGIIRGPCETEKEFLSRAEQLSSCVFSHPALEITQKLFSFSPDWVEVCFTNQGLLPWQGGCTLIEGHFIKIQLRKAFLYKKKIYGIYSRDELIAHEFVHAARMAFEEPLFEEILAYRTSTTRFRRYWGPLFRSSFESFVFVLCLAGAFVNPLYTIGLLLGPLYYIGRLVRLQNIFRRALKRLPLSELVRLSDKEIIAVSRGLMTFALRDSPDV